MSSSSLSSSDAEDTSDVEMESHGGGERLLLPRGNRGRSSNSDDDEDSDFFYRETRMDGLVVVARNLAFFQPLGNLRISFPLWLQKLTQRAYKGVRLLQSSGCTFYRVILGNPSGSPLSVVFQANDREPIDYGQVSIIMADCIRRALACMPNSATTRSVLCSGVRKRNKETKWVLMDDIPEFGEHLYRILREASRRMGFRHVYFVQAELGQNCSVAAFRRILHTLLMKPNSALEVVFHIDLDFYAVDGNEILLWREDVVSKRFADLRKSECYHTAAIPGCGGFNFVSNEISQPIVRGQPTLTRVKLYSEVFRDVHNCEGPPFRRRRVSDWLWNGCNNSNIGDADDEDERGGGRKENNRMVNTLWSRQKFLDQCRIVSNNIKFYTRLEGGKRVMARAEFYVSIVKPARDFNFDSFLYGEVGRELTRQQHLDGDCFFRISKTELKEHFEQFLIPALNTIRKTILEVPVTGLQTGQQERGGRRGTGLYPTFFLTPREYVNLAAAEIVICFHVYGLAYGTRICAGHDNKLVRLIRCDKSMFRKNLCDVKGYNPLQAVLKKSSSSSGMLKVRYAVFRQARRFTIPERNLVHFDRLQRALQQFMEEQQGRSRKHDVVVISGNHQSSETSLLLEEAAKLVVLDIAKAAVCQAGESSARYPSELWFQIKMTEEQQIDMTGMRRIDFGICNSKMFVDKVLPMNGNKENPAMISLMQVAILEAVGHREQVYAMFMKVVAKTLQQWLVKGKCYLVYAFPNSATKKLAVAVPLPLTIDEPPQLFRRQWYMDMFESLGKIYFEQQSVEYMAANIKGFVDNVGGLTLSQLYRIDLKLVFERAGSDLICTWINLRNVAAADTM